MKRMKRISHFKIGILVVLGLFVINGCQGQKGTSPQKPNVLFICVDDLRPELGCYGRDYIKSPNIDGLAATGCMFTNEFVSVPTCGASRYSMLTGMLPRAKGHLSNEACRKYISHQPEKERPETFIHQLRRNGYYTVGIGKISHYPDGRLYKYLDPVGTDLELPHSWDEMLLDAGKWGTGWNAFFAYADGTNRNGMNKNVKPYECANVPDEGYPDGLTANLAIKKLKELKQKGQPFFLGVGFIKPHLPFNAPKKYWDLYDEENIPLTPSPDIPENVNLASLHNSPEFNQYKLGDEEATLGKPVSVKYEKKLRHAYFACVSYTDAQVGKVLDELKKLGLDKNTIVVLWGDHGWHLGDDRVWGKHTIFEWALKSAFIIKTPEMNQGFQCNNVVRSVDIYPTVLDLCGVESPVTDGKSMAELLDRKDEDWENTAYSYFRDGITVRTKRYRLTKYFRKEEPVVELYDHQNDPYENHNIAGEHKAVVDSLMTIWEKGNTGLYLKN